MDPRIQRAMIDDFRLEHLDIQAADSRLIAYATNWTFTENDIRTPAAAR
jgi:hypothetical protein